MAEQTVYISAYIMKRANTFFDKHYQTPEWFNAKKNKDALSRRHFLKSAAGASTLVALPVFSLTAQAKSKLTELAHLTQIDPWLTLAATLQHLLPRSPTGPSAEEINALSYLYQVLTVQPTEQQETDFIVKGVGWLNGYAKSELGRAFIDLSFTEKETILRGISHSRAGENWLSTLLAYLFEAMLSAPAYGGNSNGEGWQWLEHQPGFPLPTVGQRYFELPPRGLAQDIMKKDISMQTVTKTRSKTVLAAKFNTTSRTKS